MAEAAKSVSESYRQREWKRFIKGPDPSLLEDLYIPMLAGALRYDRCCAYFSSSVLAAAARGFARLIQKLEEMGEQAPRPSIRLLVNEELSAEDVRALTENAELSRLEAVLQNRFKNPRDVLERQRLEMLAWLVKKNLLEVRVGVMRGGGGILHAKFGITTDAGADAIVFSGSGNETAKGLAGNYERLEVSASWEDPLRFAEYRDEFNELWQDTHGAVHTVSLPEALRLKLIKLAPEEAPIIEPSNAMARQKAAMAWRYVLEAPYFKDGGAACDATAMVDLWPHQTHAVRETAAAWPSGRLLCDEVGMGKTIEAILVLRRLLAGRGASRALLLLPAGLVRQWQAELREKGGLLVPRLEGVNQLVWPDGREQKLDGLPEALEQDLLLMSRETARTEGNLPALLNAKPWDLVLLDEAHAARRKKQEEGEFNSGTLLLDLVRQLQLRRKTRGFLFLSATPMQTQPWEPWDLLAVLGEGGAWLSDFGEVRNFYDVIASLRYSSPDLKQARRVASLIATDSDFPSPNSKTNTIDRIESLLCFQTGTPDKRVQRANWLRHGSPLARRMQRNTRDTLRGYYRLGLLAAPPPDREVEDLEFDYRDRAERSVYNSVTHYIEKRYTELEEEKPGKGFVMTIYRRRASSSPLALQRSLARRRENLLRVIRSAAYDYTLAAGDIPEALDADELPEGESTTKISAAVPQNPAAARAELQEVDKLLEELRALGARDSKRDFFFDQLRRLTDDGRAILVFTEYADTMEYLREALAPNYGSSLGCYSGAGGHLLVDGQWKSVGKANITKALYDRQLQVLVCTDAASEGLNLQVAGALINYDLPWNPSKVEQRIGRIDRIGQKYDSVRVVNLFLADSIDERVYRALEQRCGLFRKFVGAMQPVLAHASRMLRGEEPPDPAALQAIADEAEADPIAHEIYMDSPAVPVEKEQTPFDRNQWRTAAAFLTKDIGFDARWDEGSGVVTIGAASFSRTKFSARLSALEGDAKIVPLTPLTPRLHDLVGVLTRPGECLPLIAGSYNSGAFRASAAYWLEADRLLPLECFADLETRLQAWDGATPEPAAWRSAAQQARKEAQQQVEAMIAAAQEREQAALARQIEAARLRLVRELGRYLGCLGEGTADLNRVWYSQMRRDIAGASRLKFALERLRGYPTWPDDLLADLQDFIAELPENRRKARLLGAELDAALEDPRWAALV